MQPAVVFRFSGGISAWPIASMLPLNIVACASSPRQPARFVRDWSQRACDTCSSSWSSSMRATADPRCDLLPRSCLSPFPTPACILARGARSQCSSISEPSVFCLSSLLMSLGFVLERCEVRCWVWDSRLEGRGCATEMPELPCELSEQSSWSARACESHCDPHCEPWCEPPRCEPRCEVRWQPCPSCPVNSRHCCSSNWLPVEQLCCCVRIASGEQEGPSRSR
mmetsp:Transcript_63908/g.177300  ORF Transcript_63908/g.177300 Transcript_63908/m.177300 type:complete len:224 (-) Transcript_63908:160-831(-)